MDLLVILRDALASSLAGGLLAALDARKAGREVAVLFTQEALAALARGTFAWPRELSGQELRWILADRGKELGIPVLGRGEGRQLDPRGLVARAREEGVAVYACPLWWSLLGLEGAPPDGVELLKREAAARLLGEARQVIGTL